MSTISKEQAMQLALEAGWRGWPLGQNEFIKRFGQAAYKLGRNAGLEEAKLACKNEELTDDLLVAEDCAYNNAISHASAAIESLKDKA